MTCTGKGKVYLVGAGPGDPGLLTLKGKECLQKADVIVYDNLANRAFLEHAGPGAEVIYAGKEGSRHTLSQEEINRLLVQKAAQGLQVVRLKGGDPFIFGRGGEEAQELVQAHIPFEIIPGITSAIAVPAYAGIPLTHREVTSTVAFITGHEDPTKEHSSIPWDKLTTGAGTLVFLMGVGNLPKIAQSLMIHGRPPETPAAVIQNGTAPGQRTVTGTLREIAEKARIQKIRPPAIIVIGDVVKLREELNWFESRPLYGKRIIVTRAREQASDFVLQLRDLGAECIEFPTIQVIPPESWEPLDHVIENLHHYDWLLFTSVNGVRYFFERLDAKGRDGRDLKGVKIGTIGPKTEEAMRGRGIRPDLVPEEFRAEGLVECFRRQGAKDLKILIPRAAQAREILPEELKRMGALVEVVDAYRTVKPMGDVHKVRDLLAAGEIHMVTFTSSSTVRNFAEMFHSEGDPFALWMEKTAIACIGPVTAKTAEEMGFKVGLTAAEYTIPALAKAIVQFFSSSSVI
jgi:uroporphyrinogen III methyltransferase / synthase